MLDLPVLPASSIILPKDRQREGLPEAHIRELAKSIKNDCLIHAPTITDSLDLVAGFCRLQAILLLNEEYEYAGKRIPAGHVPVVFISGKSEEQLFRIELEENLRRKNLTPVEESKAIAKLHRMLAARATASGTTHTNTDTAEVLKDLRSDGVVGNTEVADNLLIEQFADDPDVQRAKTRAEAVKLSKRKLEAVFTQGLGALTTLRRDDFQLLEGDANAILPTLVAGTYAGIIADPPYGIDAESFGEQSYHAGHSYADGRDNALAVAELIFNQGFRLCKTDAHLYMFCDIRMWPELYHLAARFGWQPYATPLIWHKPNAGHAPQPGFFTRRYEAILFARKGERKLITSAPDVLSFPSVKNKSYAAEKPTELLEYLMKLSFFPGETVLDPTCGSGSIFPAAKAAGLRATGVESFIEAINISKKRIGEL